jgi:hypothetical protein
MLKSIASVVLLLCLITLATRTVEAQSVQKFKIIVPFSFVLNGKTLPAGEYFVERTDPAKPNIVTLKRIDGGIVRVVLTQHVEKDNPSTASSLVFIQRDGKRYLFQVWNVGAMNGSQIPLPIDKDAIDQRQDRKLVTVRTSH